MAYTYVSDAVIIANESQSSMAIGTSAVQSGAMSLSGVFDLLSTIDCFIKVGVSADDVTTSSGYFLLANNVVPVQIAMNSRVGAVTASGSGTLRWHKVQSI